MKRKRYTKEELDVIVRRMEGKLGAEYFYHPTAKVVELAVIAPHSEECRCDACVHAYLEAMEKNREVDTEINYI